jgi:hypothetical protein
VRVLGALLVVTLGCGAPHPAPPLAAAAPDPIAEPSQAAQAPSAPEPAQPERSPLLAIDMGPPKQLRRDPPEPSDLCRRAMPKLIRPAAELPTIPDYGAAGFAPSRLLAYCWSAKGGAWAMIAAGLRATRSRGDDAKILGSMRLVFLHASGAIVRGPTLEYHATTTETVRFHGQPLASDAEEPRIALVRIRGGRTGDGYADGAVYALRKGRIATVVLPARSIEAAIDVDGDGLDDLVTDWPFSGETCRCECQAHTSQIGPTLVLHAVPKGGFRADDDVARAWAEAECPERPPGPPPLSEVPGDFALLRWIRCSRLRGIKVDALRSKIDETCAGRSKDACDPCRSPLLLYEWADAVPPFVLP